MILVGMIVFLRQASRSIWCLGSSGSGLGSASLLGEDETGRRRNFDGDSRLLGCPCASDTREVGPNRSVDKSFISHRPSPRLPDAG